MSDPHEGPAFTGYLKQGGKLHAMEFSSEFIHFDGDASKPVKVALWWVRPCCARAWVPRDSIIEMDYRYRGNGDQCRHQACVSGFAYLDANP